MIIDFNQRQRITPQDNREAVEQYKKYADRDPILSQLYHHVLLEPDPEDIRLYALSLAAWTWHRAREKAGQHED